jgi:hypothetical protein
VRDVAPSQRRKRQQTGDDDEAISAERDLEDLGGRARLYWLVQFATAYDE